MNKITIENTDIFLENFDHGQGKITISDTYHGAYTYYWGSMGDNIQDFICRTNADYFAGKLCKDYYVFDPKASVKNVRKYIREEMRAELPWYQHMESQKELRGEIKKLEDCSDGNEFVHIMQGIPNNLYLSCSYEEEKEFKEIIEGLFTTEPWHFIGEKTSREYNYLYKLHGKLKKKLSS